MLTAAGGQSIRDIKFEQPLRLKSRTSLQTVVDSSKKDPSSENEVDQAESDSRKRIAIYSSEVESTHWVRHCTAKISSELSEMPGKIEPEAVAAELGSVVKKEEFYAALAELGLNYGTTFQCNEEICFSRTEVFVKLRSHGDIRGCQVPPPVLDAAFHSLAVGMVLGDEEALFLPVEIGRFDLWDTLPEGDIWCHAIWTQPEGSLRVADLVLYGPDGSPFAKVSDLRLKEIDRAALRKMSGSGVDRLLYQMDWKPVQTKVQPRESGNWLLVQFANDNDSECNPLGAALQQANQNVTSIRVSPRATFLEEPKGYRD